MTTDSKQTHFMNLAMSLVTRAEAAGEVPVGRVIVKDNVLLAEGWNRLLGASDASAHAAICAIRAIGQRLGNYRLVNCVLFVTLEPRMMCVSATIHARLALIYGASDPKTGAAGS